MTEFYEECYEEIDLPVEADVRELLEEADAAVLEARTNYDRALGAYRLISTTLCAAAGAPRGVVMGYSNQEKTAIRVRITKPKVETS